jgi:hypothetical protein
MRIPDFNGDARLDLAVANSADNSVTILINTGSCSFTEQPRIAVDAFPWTLALADLDGDTDLDIIVGSRDAGTITELRSLGNGTFYKGRSYPAGMAPSSVALGDLYANSAKSRWQRAHPIHISDGVRCLTGPFCAPTFSA